MSPLRARAATIEGKGQWAGTRPDTLQPLDLYMPTFPSHQWPAPPSRVVEREVGIVPLSPRTRKKKTTVNKGESFM